MGSKVWGFYRYLGVLKGVSSEDNEYLVKIGVFNWKYVLRGRINKNILVGIYQYLVKLGVFFDIP